MQNAMDVAVKWFVCLKTQIIKGWAQRHQFKDFFTKSKDIYSELMGVDFDSTAILCVKLSRRLGKIHVVQASQIALPADTVTDEGVIHNGTLFVNTLRSALLQLQVKAKKIAIAMPGSKVIFRQAKLKKIITESEAENLAWQEAKKSFPNLFKNLLLDFSLIKNKNADELISQTLILVIARQEDVIPRVEILGRAGLITKIVDVDYCAIARAYALFASQLPREHVNQHVAILNFDSHNLILVIMHNHHMMYVNRHAFLDNPSLLKISLMSPLSEEQKLQLILQIKRLFQLFFTDFNEKSIDHIVLTGRYALIPNLKTEVEKELNIAVTIGDPLAALGVDSEKVKNGPAFTICCGLAMRGMAT